MVKSRTARGEDAIAASLLTVLVLVLPSCQCFDRSAKTEAKGGAPTGASFGDDMEFLQKHTDVFALSDAAGQARVAVCPAMQGRVLTSTAAGEKGLSFGWINRELIASGKTLEHMNPFGGEDRFWLGPEGGQFSIFFQKGVPFDLAHWFTPAPLDTEPFDLVSRSGDRAVFSKKMALTNYSGTKFQVEARREIRLLSEDEAKDVLGVVPPARVKHVAFQSENRISNGGRKGWEKKTGLLSIWVLGMFNPSPQTVVVIPFRAGPEARLGPIVNDAYFGKVPADRLAIGKDVLFFRGDGGYRSKIGLSPLRAKGVLGSYDAANQALTVVVYTQPKDETDYVNSMWELQDKPFAGDTANSYNDGPPAPGAKPLGPFYELESSSPAGALGPGASMTHIHRTFHFQGAEKDLDVISRAVLGVSIEEIKGAF